MKKRDLEIVKALEKFRALSRDHIAEMFFSHTKNAITNANYTLKRLRRDGHIEVKSSSSPYVYFPSPSRIKKDGQKVEHFLEIASFYLELLKHSKPKTFIIEPQYDDMRPDIFMIWRGAPFWVEIQRSIYSKRVMSEKIKRYEKYFYSNTWKELEWQPENKPVYPRIWIVAPNKYTLGQYSFRILQTKNAKELIDMAKKPMSVRVGSTTKTG